MVFQEARGNIFACSCRLCDKGATFTSQTKEKNEKKHSEHPTWKTLSTFLENKQSTRGVDLDSSMAETSTPNASLGDSQPKRVCQTNILSSFAGSRTKMVVSQNDVDAVTEKLIVQEMLPFHLVERPAFIEFVQALRPEKKVMSRGTLMRGIKKAYCRKKSLIRTLEAVESMATMCDLWSAHNR